MYGLNPLRRARQERGLTLEDVARLTHLSPRVLARIELGDFASLPPGLFARAHIRAYAEAVGLSGTETLDRLSELLPQVSDPLDALRARERRRWADMHPWLGRADAYARTLTAAGRTWTRTRLDDGLDLAWRRGVAGIVDGVVLAGVGASLVTGAAVITGVPVRDLARAVPVPLALTWLLLAGQYLLLTSGLGGRTPGAVIARCGRTGERRLSLSPRAVSRRAAQTVLEESLAVAGVSLVLGAWRTSRLLPWGRRSRVRV